jgi:transcriptional regulator with PAS, ATPase and Fis domain
MDRTMSETTTTIKLDYINEFKRLLDEKQLLDHELDRLRTLIADVIETFPDGITVQSADELPRLYSQCYRFMPPQHCAVLLAPDIWSIVCDASDTILAVSSNLGELLGYATQDLIGAYKGKLWAERPDKADSHQPNRASYLIYEVKQKHFHGTHEDAFISSDGRVVSILQHRLNLTLPDGSIAGSLYLILNIQQEKSTDYALAEIMGYIEHELQYELSVELTPEMRRYLVHDLITTREYIEGVLANAIDGILVTSPAGLIIGSNQSFKRLVGYTDRELTNQPVTIVSPGIGAYPLTIGGTVNIEEQYFIDMANMIDNLFTSSEIYGFRQFFRGKDGHLIPTEVNISLLRNKKGDITGFIRNIHDLSEKERLQKEIIEKQEQISLLQKEIIEYYGPENIVGKSPAMQIIFRLMTKVAETDSTVLLQGESGTGKELVAHALYNLSPRKGKPFVVLNCGAIPQNLLESELFGHVKGSFTGAIRDKKGLFEEADGGVIFLDEIGELPLDMQVKLLRTIQEREIKRVGDNRSIKIDVRIIAATHKDLLEETRQKTFRDDLYYRINVVTIKLPPLRERREDIPLLIDFLMQKNRPGRQIKISREAMRLLLEYKYPGNVRELENIIERAIILCEGETILPEDLPPEVVEKRNTTGQAAGRNAEGLRHAVSRSSDIAEKEMIEKALRESDNNRAVAATMLKIGRTSLYRKMKKFGLE